MAKKTRPPKLTPPSADNEEDVSAAASEPVKEPPAGASDDSLAISWVALSVPLAMVETRRVYHVEIGSLSSEESDTLMRLQAALRRRNVEVAWGGPGGAKPVASLADCVRYLLQAVGNSLPE